MENLETLETKEYLKFQIYPIYNAEKDELRDAMVVDIAQNGVFVLDPYNNSITTFNFEGYPDWGFSMKERLLHQEPKLVNYVEVEVTDFANLRNAEEDEIFTLVKLRNGRIAVIYKIYEAEYCYDGFILTPSEFFACTWNSKGFVYANIPTENDIVAILRDRETITYN